MFARLFVLSVLILCALGLANFQAFAQVSYKRENFGCSNFVGMERLHKIRPESLAYTMGYAKCLLHKRDKGDNAIIALDYMRYLRDHHGFIPAAYGVALYAHTGGKFDRNLDFNEVHQSIEDYHKLLSLINSDNRYPNNGFRYYEVEDQMELRAYYNLPFLYRSKFWNGIAETHYARLLEYPSYTSDMYLFPYPEYSPYTLDSLDRVVHYGRECQSLPKKQHFNAIHYKAFTEGCRLYVELARTLKPLDEKRLSILNRESCQDLNPDTCPEYYEVLDEIVDLLKQTEATQEEVFQPVYEYEKMAAEAYAEAYNE